MKRRLSAFALCAFAACAAPEVREPNWLRLPHGVWRSPATPAVYALAEGDAALLFGAAEGADPAELAHAGITTVDAVYLTHAHRPSIRQAAAWIAAGIPVRASRITIEQLSPDVVRDYWAQAPSPPRAGWSYLVPAEGIDGLQPAGEITWRGWTLTPVPAPGPGPDHTAYVCRRGDVVLVFAGGLLSAPGIVPHPYSTEWSAGGDEGLASLAASLRALAALKPSAVFPEHGAPIKDDPAAALQLTAERAEEAAFLKSYARFAQRLGSGPSVRFLAREQVGSDGRRPWSRISDRLYVTGSTYGVGSRNGPTWIVNPSGELLAAQLIRLRYQHFSGDPGLVTITHASAEHYLGLAEVIANPPPAVWTLDHVASVLASPGYHRAPRLLPQAVDVDRVAKEGEALDWREFKLTFHALPVPTRFGSAIETAVDGKRVLFTGDAFFHPEQDLGCGGWSGLAGSLPVDYAAAATTILDLRPDSILASRGGPFEFVKADWERRIRWAEEAGKACDRLSPSGDHRLDWDPVRVRAEPFVSTTSPGQTVSVELVGRNRTERPRRLEILVEGQTRELTLPPKQTARTLLTLRLPVDAPKGRRAYPLRIYEDGIETGDDASFLIDVR